MIVEAVAVLGGAAGAASLWRARAQNAADQAQAQRSQAEAESLLVGTARGLVAEVRAEMDRRVSALDQEIGRLRAQLEATQTERDRLRAQVDELLGERGDLLRELRRVEARVIELQRALAAAEAARD